MGRAGGAIEKKGKKREKEKGNPFFGGGGVAREAHHGFPEYSATGRWDHVCVVCGMAMPLEDGHAACMYWMGHHHALLARENSQARTRKACFHLFDRGMTCQGAPLPEARPRKLPRHPAVATVHCLDILMFLFLYRMRT